MKLELQLFCDGCPAFVVSDSFNVPTGWASVALANTANFTYCSDCWAVMFCSLISPHARERAMSGDAKSAILGAAQEKNNGA